MTLAALSAGPACAHIRLLKAERAAPGQLRLRFGLVPRMAGLGVRLRAADGRLQALRPLTQDPADVRAIVAPLPAGLAPGRYEVLWRVRSTDAHRGEGRIALPLK